MLTSIAAGRRLSWRAILWQLVAVAVVALAFLVKGPVWSLAAAVGGSAVVLGGWLFGVIALGGGVNASTGVLARMLLGVLLKWVVAIGVLVVGVGAGLPPLPLLAGVVVALVMQMLAMTSGQQAKARRA